MWGRSVRTTVGCVAAAALVGLSGAASAETRTEALERKLEAMEAQMSALKSELARMQADEAAQGQAMQAVESRVSSVETAAVEPVRQVEQRVTKLETARPEKPGNMIFFRGGYTGLTDDRASGVFTDLYGLGNDNDADSGWYVGAGFDFLLTRNTWGLLPGTWVLAELGVEFSHVDSEETILTVPTAACALATGNVGAALPGCLITGENNLTMLTVSASPKIELLEGSKLRPWIIPVGLDFRVVSPPSDTSSYLDVGGQTAIGADYELIPGIKLGADFRYHFAADFTNPDYDAATVAAIQGLGLSVEEPSNDYWTAGLYLGIGF